MYMMTKEQVHSKVMNILRDHLGDDITEESDIRQISDFMGPGRADISPGTDLLDEIEIIMSIEDELSISIEEQEADDLFASNPQHMIEVICNWLKL